MLEDNHFLGERGLPWHFTFIVRRVDKAEGVRLLTPKKKALSTDPNAAFRLAQAQAERRLPAPRQVGVW